jgi:hypothetical protein
LHGELRMRVFERPRRHRVDVAFRQLVAAPDFLPPRRGTRPRSSSVLRVLAFA